MNRQHLQAVLWLRWRLMVNQARRAGTVNAVLMMIVAIGALVTAVPLFIAGFALGIFAIPKAAPAHLMYAWDAVLAAFLLFWGIGLLTELQRNDPLSLSKFLHLPVSANGAFLINYLSSLLRLSLIAFGPIMLAFALSLIYVKGASQLVVLPLLAAFLLMITALTYQFQGWLASLMNNPRLRRTVIMGSTAFIIVVAQLPTLLNMLAPWGPHQQASRSAALVKELKELERGSKAKEFGASEYLSRQQDAIQRNKLANEAADRQGMERAKKMTSLVNAVLPIGWLPLGVMSAAEGRFLPSILGMLGMTLIGTASLWRAYRTTVGIYQGQPTNRKGRPAAVAAAPPTATPRTPGRLLLEARLPGFSEPVSVIALGGLRSILRSPEAKITLLTPLIMTAIFGSMIVRGGQAIPELVRPLLAIGAMVFVLFSVLQLSGNQFGFDRDGFRVFVLCAASRRDILLGKNLAYAPVTLGMGAILVTAVQLVCPMRLDHLLAMIPQYLSMFLIFCLLTNLVAIYAPIYIAPGAMRPSNPKMTHIFIQLGMFMLLFPLAQLPTLLPLGLEALAESMGWTRGVPIYLPLALVECGAVLLIYRFLLEGEGRLLQAREQRILETVTNRAP